jgi:hypothetical protein
VSEDIGGKVNPCGMKFVSIGVSWRFDQFVKGQKAQPKKAKSKKR